MKTMDEDNFKCPLNSSDELANLNLIERKWINRRIYCKHSKMYSALDKHS